MHLFIGSRGCCIKLTESKVKTPCIGVCSTGIGDSVCRGCKRFAHEVIRWNGYSEAERRAIVERIEHLLVPLVQARVRVLDEALLKSSLLEQKVRVDHRWGIYTYVYEAIRTFGAQLSSLEAIGCELTADWQGCTVGELKTALEDDFYRISCAHYERYFPGHI